MDTQELGPFAPDAGNRDPAVTAGIAVAVAAFALALVRPAFDLAGSEADASTRLAVPAGLAGLALGLAGLYRTSVRSLPGRRAALAAIALGATAAAGAFLYAAVAEGEVRLGRFGRAYFDAEILRAIWRPMLRGAVNTIRAAAIAEVFAIAVGLLIATFTLSRRKALRIPAYIHVDVFRSIPLLVVTSLVFFGLAAIGVRLSAFAAVVASLTINASVYIAEIFRAGIQAVPRGQIDAARGLGMPHATTMATIVIPQAVRTVIPPLMSEFIALLKDTAIVFAIVGFTTRSADIFGVARTAAASTFSPTPYMAATIAYLAIILPLTRVVALLERRLRAGLA